MKIGNFLIFVLFLTNSLCKFPNDFKFGAATSAFQIEGAWLADNKAPSVWDNLSHLPGFTPDGMAPEIGAESYYRYKEDIELMKNAGIKHYRLSISWPRIIPRGRVDARINMIAIDHYRQMFKDFLEAGITPYVTLFHGDLPILLQIQDYAFRDRYFTDHFMYYADTCFKYFGDLVKYWFTFNEPWCMAVFEDVKQKEAGTAPYEIAHNVLITHAKVVQLYRQKYKTQQNGQIGIVLNTDFFYPKDPQKPEDIEAANRAFDFMLGWFADPLFFGDYPERLKKKLGNRLPTFKPEESELVKNSIDFFAFNHYQSSLSTDANYKEGNQFWRDRNISDSYKPEWKLTDCGWAVVPEGLHDILMYIQHKYIKDSKMPVFITENGMANKEKTRKDAENDDFRIEYMKGYLEAVERAKNEGSNINGYFAWSLLDNYEWSSGFTTRFGIVRVEVGEIPVRIPKKSYYWYKDFIKNNQ